MIDLKQFALIFIAAVFAMLLQQDAFSQNRNSQYRFLEGFNYYEIIYGRETKDMPVLVAFHYSSSTPEEISKYYDSIAKPVRVIIPRGTYEKRNGYSYFPADHYTKDSLTQDQTVKLTVDKVAAFLKALKKKHNVLPVVSGASQGGDISLLLAVYYPKLIKASFPLLSFVHRQRYETLSKPAAVQVPIFMYQGEADEIVPFKYTQKEVSFLERNYKIKLTGYPKIGHDISVEMKHDLLKTINEYL